MSFGSSILFLLLGGHATAFATVDPGHRSPQITSENIEIHDNALEKRLSQVLREKGTLTSTRQVDSYMIAVLCEYPHAEIKGKPYCTFRKVQLPPKE